MNTTTIPIKERQESHKIVFFIFLSITIAFKYYFTDILFNYSTFTFIPFIQNKLDFSYLPKILKYLGLTCTHYIYLAITIIIYNYGNVYKTYFILISLSRSSLFIAILKLFFLSPRPFWQNDNIKIYKCSANYGTVSSHIFTGTVFYLILWKIYFQSSRNRHRYIIKYISLFINILFIFTIGFSQLYMGISSIDQVIFSILCAICYYFFVFHVMNFYCNSNRQILNYIKSGLSKINIFMIICFIIYVILYVYRNKNFSTLIQEEEIYKKLKTKCSNTNLNYMSLYKNNNTTKNIEIEQSKILMKDTLILAALFLSNLGSSIGLKLEYILTFDRNDNYWTQYNFEVDENDSRQARLIASSKIVINKEIQWNHTSFIKSICRLLVIIILVGICAVPFYLVTWEENIYMVVGLKVGVSVNLIGFGLFFVFKKLLKWLKLTNLTLYTMLRESI